MSARQPVARLLAGLTGVAVALLMTAAPAYAEKGGSEARPGRVALSCTAGVKGKLQAKPRNGSIELELELESHRPGQTWNVSVTDNGASVHSGSHRTAGPNGEFKVAKRIADRAGTDNLVARATLAGGGGSCSGNLSV